MIQLYLLEGTQNYLIIAVLYVLIEWMLCKFYHKNQLKTKPGFVIGWQMLVLLMVIIFSITGAGGIHDIGRHGSQLIRLDEINLIPFHWTGGRAFGLVTNALMFLPLGVLLPLLFEQGIDFKNTVLCGFTFSLLIEVSQLFNWRATDIDDLLMNTLGAAIGYGIYYLCLRGVQGMQLRNRGNRWVIRNSPLVSVVTIFAVYFIIGGYLVNLFWPMIYG